jgi:hypothetical protein
MDQTEVLDNHKAGRQNDMLLVVGGTALMVIGAGLLLTVPAVRKHLSNINVKALLQAAAPQFERYLNLTNV